MRRRAWVEEPPLAVVAVLLGAIAASRFLAIAASPGEIDEAVFAGAVTRFDLFDLSPQAPGFPLWILIGRLLLPVLGSPFEALCVASAALSAAAMPALYLWGRRLVGGWAALAGALVAASLPVVWVNSGRAFSDSPATAFFLVALALLFGAVEVEPRESPREEAVASRKARLLALGAGLAAAAGAGVRLHLVLAFGPALALGLFLLLRQGKARRDAAFSFFLAGLAGTLAWGAWLAAQAGGAAGLVGSLREREAFREHAFATGTFGTLSDSFLVRDFLSPRRALLVAALALAGGVALLRGRRGKLGELGLVLVPTFLSLWFLHSRAMSRYSIPFVLVAALLMGAGLAALLRHPVPVLAGGLALAFFFGRQAWPEVRASAREETPPIAAIRHLERYVHPGRETIVADEVFHSFLRLERWEGRLVAWGYLDTELLSARRQMNRRLVRLADFTAGGGPPANDPLWRSWFRGGRVAEELGNRRLLSVAVRDPAPPLFGPGFGVREDLPGKPSFRWAGTLARLIVPGLQGPPAALLSGERPAEGGPTRLRVVEAETGIELTARLIEPGPFDLVVIPPQVYGPLRAPVELLISCDRPVPLSRMPGAVRPLEGCFTFRDVTASRPADTLWTRRSGRFFVDVGSPDDVLADLAGFHARERLAPLGIDMRWTSRKASVVWVPVRGFSPRRLVLRVRPPQKDAVDLDVLVGGTGAGTIHVPPGDFAERALDLPPSAAGLLSRNQPVRIELVSPTTWCPKQAGQGDDARELGVALDWIGLE